MTEPVSLSGTGRGDWGGAAASRAPACCSVWRRRRGCALLIRILGRGRIVGAEAVPRGRTGASGRAACPGPGPEARRAALAARPDGPTAKPGGGSMPSFGGLCWAVASGLSLAWRRRLWRRRGRASPGAGGGSICRIATGSPASLPGKKASHAVPSTSVQNTMPAATASAFISTSPPRSPAQSWAKPPLPAIIMIMAGSAGHAGQRHELSWPQPSSWPPCRLT